MYRWETDSYSRWGVVRGNVRDEHEHQQGPLLGPVVRPPPAVLAPVATLEVPSVVAGVGAAGEADSECPSHPRRGVGQWPCDLVDGGDPSRRLRRFAERRVGLRPEADDWPTPVPRVVTDLVELVPQEVAASDGQRVRERLLKPNEAVPAVRTTLIGRQDTHGGIMPLANRSAQPAIPSDRREEAIAPDRRLVVMADRHFGDGRHQALLSGALLRWKAMIVWLNGAFGVGKTTVAKELAAIVPNVQITDPERIGYVMRRTFWRHADYQDVPLWRRLTRMQVAQAGRRRVAIVPMTIVRREVFDEVTQGTRVFLLVASRAVHEERIGGTDEAQEWRHLQLDRCLHAFSGGGLGEPIATDGRDPAAIARSIADHL